MFVQSTILATKNPLSSFLKMKRNNASMSIRLSEPKDGKPVSGSCLDGRIGNVFIWKHGFYF